MAAILSAGGLSLKELSVQLGLAHSTTSGIVDRLEKKDLVARRVDDSDRRSSKIEATAAVIKFVEETMPRISIHPLVEALRRATPEERAAISTGLKTLRAALSTRE
jgi:DNA-binding MarR family transcriptional regulator